MPLHDMTSKEMAIPMSPAIVSWKNPIVSPSMKTDLLHQGSLLHRQSLWKAKSFQNHFNMTGIWWCMCTVWEEWSMMGRHFRLSVDSWQSKMYYIGVLQTIGCKYCNTDAVVNGCFWTHSTVCVSVDLLQFSRLTGPPLCMSWHPLSTANCVCFL